MSKRMKRSAVWDYFKKKGDDKVACTLCQVELKYSSGTSSMSNHLAKKHCIETSQTATSSKQQSSMEAYVQQGPVRRCDSRRSEEITQKICKMIELDMMPISTVDGDGFIELINFLEPEYDIPCRTTITSRIEKRYKDMARNLKKRLSTADRVALTTDGWTALTTESYITITSHYIDQEWALRSDVLLTQGVSVRHTAENLAEHLKSSVDDWGLTDRVIACVHDNASNIVKANSPAYVDWKSVPCFAHTLQLAINDGFALYMHRVIAAAGRLVKHFNHSTPATEALKTKQEQLNMAEKKLIQSCKTRWNSVYDMFERLIEQRWAVTAVLSDRTVTKLSDARVLDLSSEHWKLMEEMLPVLKTLKTATTAMSTESDVSVSNTYPISFSFIQAHLTPLPEEEKKVTEFKAKVSASLSKRMKVGRPI